MTLIRAIMGMITLLALLVLLFFTCWILAAGCSRAHILVTNQSGATISNLVIAGSCKERHADTLIALSEWRTVTPYQSGGTIQFSFASAGKSYVAEPDNYTNRSGFCAIAFTVNSNMVVKSGVRY
jgi:hypothetical protein